eukprot:gene1379-2656_t
MIRIVFLLSLLINASVYSFSLKAVRFGSPIRSTVLNAGPQSDDETQTRIATIISQNKIVLFMKGNKLFPQCGFSNTACRVLDAVSAQYETVNVLEDERIRNGIKVFSSWPTIPQLYVDGEFIGGSDIIVELYQNGKLAEMIEVLKAS